MKFNEIDQQKSRIGQLLITTWWNTFNYYQFSKVLIVCAFKFIQHPTSKRSDFILLVSLHSTCELLESRLIGLSLNLPQKVCS